MIGGANYRKKYLRTIENKFIILSKSLLSGYGYFNGFHGSLFAYDWRTIHLQNHKLNNESE